MELTFQITYPSEWQPSVVSIQLAIIGNVVLAAVPGEFTTMSGRRLKEAISKVVEEKGGSRDVKVVLSGLSNLYSDYITTPEEYQVST